MSSERRIRASRANGALSQGPISDAGKAVSSRNGLRHGILAQTVVLDDEDSELFATLLSTLENELRPGDETDRALIENMAVARWRLMRLWGMEKAGLCHEMEKHQSSALNSPTRAALAFRSLSDESRSLDVLGRYETRYDRQYARALNLLLKRKVLNGKFPHEPSPGNEHCDRTRPAGL